MHRRQVLVAVAEMVLAELAGGVALGLQHFGEGHGLRLQPQRATRQADGGHAGADRQLPGNEGGAAGGAAGLAVVVAEDRAFLGDAVDVRCAVAHGATVVGAEVPQADVVAPDHHDVGLVRRLGEGQRQ
ncbi:hypothetical protein D3C81_1652930 [compost metagenome]